MIIRLITRTICFYLILLFPFISAFCAWLILKSKRNRPQHFNKRVTIYFVALISFYYFVMPILKTFSSVPSYLEHEFLAAYLVISVHGIAINRFFIMLIPLFLAMKAYFTYDFPYLIIKFFLCFHAAIATYASTIFSFQFMFHNIFPGAELTRTPWFLKYHSIVIFSAYFAFKVFLKKNKKLKIYKKTTLPLFLLSIFVIFIVIKFIAILEVKSKGYSFFRLIDLSFFKIYGCDPRNNKLIFESFLLTMFIIYITFAYEKIVVKLRKIGVTILYWINVVLFEIIFFIIVVRIAGDLFFFSSFVPYYSPLVYWYCSNW